MAEHNRYIDRGWSSREEEITLDDGTKKKVNVPFRDIEQRPYTDAEIIAELPAYVRLTTGRTTITANGVDETVVIVELVSAPLTNDTQQNLRRAENVAVMVDDEPVILQLDSFGTGTLEISAADAGQIVIMVDSHRANSITIEAV